MGQSRPHFSNLRMKDQQCCWCNGWVDGILTADLWCQKQLLYPPSHRLCPVASALIPIGMSTVLIPPTAEIFQPHFKDQFSQCHRIDKAAWVLLLSTARTKNDISKIFFNQQPAGWGWLTYTLSCHPWENLTVPKKLQDEWQTCVKKNSI